MNHPADSTTGLVPGVVGTPAESKGRITAEIIIVLGLTLGISALRSVVSFVDRATRDVPIAQQTASLNPARSQREIFDFLYQVLSILADLVPVALVCWLLWQTARPHLARIGLSGERWGRDVLIGLGIAAAIGVPGLGLYLAGRLLGQTAQVDPAGLTAAWWTIPILVLSALRAGLLEEVVGIGYLFARLRQLGWQWWQIIVATASLRGLYHVYQGWPAMIGNLAMGLAFGWWYAKTGRLLPLIVAHVAIDVVVFLAAPLVIGVLP